MSYQFPGLPISEPDFIALLAKLHAQPVMVVTRTLPRMLKTENPFLNRGVVCYTGWNGFIGAEFGSVVNRQRDREQRPQDAQGNVEHFFPGRLWRGKGTRLAGNKHLRMHKPTGELYLAFYPRTDKAGEIQYLWRRYCRADGEQQIATPLIEPWLVRSNPSKSPGTFKKIPWRTFTLTNLVAMRVAGNTYRLEHVPRAGRRSQSA